MQQEHAIKAVNRGMFSGCGLIGKLVHHRHFGPRTQNLLSGHDDAASTLENVRRALGFHFVSIEFHERGDR